MKNALTHVVTFAVEITFTPKHRQTCGLLSQMLKKTKYPDANADVTSAARSLPGQVRLTWYAGLDIFIVSGLAQRA